MTERKKSCFSSSILPPGCNFILTATISLYQLINPVCRGGLELEITSKVQSCTRTRKAFL